METRWFKLKQFRISQFFERQEIKFGNFREYLWIYILFFRDVTSATLEDKFDKTVLPKVMQVKNFGRSGRTKYTHLVDQDTTQMDAAWSQETQQNLKFQVHHAAGMKNVFERPSAKKKK